MADLPIVNHTHKYIFHGLSDQYQGGQQQCLPQEIAPRRQQYCYQQLALHLIYLARHQQ